MTPHTSTLWVGYGVCFMSSSKMSTIYPECTVTTHVLVILHTIKEGDKGPEL